MTYVYAGIMIVLGEFDFLSQEKQVRIFSYYAVAIDAEPRSLQPRTVLGV